MLISLLLSTSPILGERRWAEGSGGRVKWSHGRSLVSTNVFFSFPTRFRYVFDKCIHAPNLSPPLLGQTVFSSFSNEVFSRFSLFPTNRFFIVFMWRFLIVFVVCDKPFFHRFVYRKHQNTLFLKTIKKRPQRFQDKLSIYIYIYVYIYIYTHTYTPGYGNKNKYRGSRY